jgi:hypothetical protein
MFWTCRFYKTQFCKQIMLSCVIKFEICESIFFTHFKFVSESMFYNDDGFFINIRYNDHMLDPLGLLMIILFCKHLIYTSKHNMDHFSPFRMGFSQGILCSISWWSHIKTTSNNQFWKKYIVSNSRKVDLFLKITWYLEKKHLFHKTKLHVAFVLNLIVCCCILHNLVLGQNELDIVNLIHQLKLQVWSSYYYFKTSRSFFLVFAPLLFNFNIGSLNLVFGYNQICLPLFCCSDKILLKNIGLSINTYIP